MASLIKRIPISLFFLLTLVAKAQTSLPWQALQSEFTSLTDEYLKINPEASGVMALIDMPDHSRWRYSPGFKGMEKTKPLEGTETFIAASITKMFIAVCVLQLEEEGFLSIEDKVTQYIDSETIKRLTSFKGKSYEGELNIKHLLNHTSGIFDYLNKGQVHLNGYRNTPNKNYTLGERLDFALNHDAAETKLGKYHYSNTNYILLGMILEKVDKDAISNILEKRIISPLGLAHTTLQPPSRIAKSMFKGYYTDWDLTTFTLEFNKHNPAGGILTNLEDLTTFGKSLFQGRLFKSKNTLEKMLDFNKGYGLGVMLFENSKKVGRVMGHSGFDPGYTCYLIYLEELNATVVTVINQSELRVVMPAFLIVKMVAAIKEEL